MPGALANRFVSAALTLTATFAVPFGSGVAQRTPGPAGVSRLATSSVAGVAYDPQSASFTRESARDTTHRVALAVAGTLLAGYGGAAGGAINGWRVTLLLCDAVGHYPDQSLACLSNDGLVYGAVAGSLVMTAAVAAYFGTRRGCDGRAAQARAFAGALLGTVPVGLYLLFRPSVLRPASTSRGPARRARSCRSRRSSRLRARPWPSSAAADLTSRARPQPHASGSATRSV
jgi:hypothetical protein